MLFTLARYLTCGIWLLAGLYKLTHFKATTEDMARRGIPFQAFFLVLTLTLELVGSALLFTNVLVWLVALLWIGFIIIATPIYHGRFIEEGRIFFPEFVQFGKNLSLAGGLLALIALDPAKPAWLQAFLN
ncbi:MAG: DoxX family protein [Rhodocyclaceae bacterium]|nr:MAG: DoxX family protein [Rhodocyclaceae bacterium]